MCGSDAEGSDSATNPDTLCSGDEHAYCTGCIGCVGNDGSVTLSTRYGDRNSTLSAECHSK